MASKDIATRNDNTSRGPSTVTIENARIFFKNFAGREGQYNEEGNRNFGVALDEAVAAVMLEDGWNVKYLKPRDEGDEAQAWVPVTVSYRNRPPRVVMITNRYDRDLGEFVPVRVTLPEDMVEMVDYADIAHVDLILNPYSYNVNGRSGIKAYLKSIFITINQDELERKYAAIEEVSVEGAPLAIEAGPDEDIIDADIIEDEG